MKKSYDSGSVQFITGQLSSARVSISCREAEGHGGIVLERKAKWKMERV